MELASLILSILALLLSGAVAWWIQYKMDQRELNKWRRDTLTQATVKFISESAKHDNALLRYIYSSDTEDQDHLFFKVTELMDEMHSLLVIMRICDSENVLAVAQKKFDHHHGLFDSLPPNGSSEDAKDLFFTKALEKAPGVKSLDEHLKKDLASKYKLQVPD